MITKDEIRALLLDLENDRVERTISTTNTDKFGQAICAFANDLPNHKQPGYLFLGVNDDGTIHSIDVTDELLKNVAAIRTDGNLHPQPSMVVEKVTFPEGDIVVVEVQPHAFPPVRYKGRIWIRIGSRKGVASEADERLLMEKRRSNVTSWENEPCLNATIEDIDIDMFRNVYLTKAMTMEDIAEEKRDIRYLLSSFGFYDTQYNCPTNLGILFFARNLRRFIPHAYVQYVRMKGIGRVGEILTDIEFKDNLCKTLEKLDAFIGTTIVNPHPVKVSALREETIIDYPEWATRELLMNAICHRDYAARGPIQFYQYDDRIEIQNPGGLYGRANVDNFPNVNDYRNLLVAETMKVLGYVNRHSKGVFRVQNELQANGNGLPEYDFSFQTAVCVTERKAKHENGVLDGVLQTTENKEVRAIDYANGVLNGVLNDVNEVLAHQPQMVQDVYRLIMMNQTIKIDAIADNLGVGTSSIDRAIATLKSLGLLAREGRAHGRWKIER